MLFRELKHTLYSRIEVPHDVLPNNAFTENSKGVKNIMMQVQNHLYPVTIFGGKFGKRFVLSANKLKL